MKKLVVAVSLAVLMGGVSALHAQCNASPATPYYQTHPTSPCVNSNGQQQMAQQALISRATQDKNKVNLTYKKVWEYYTTNYTSSPSITGAYTTGTTTTHHSSKPYPVNAGETFSGYVYQDQNEKMNYVLVSDEVWNAIEENCQDVGHSIRQTFKTTEGVEISGQPKSITDATVNKQKYKVVAFPFPKYPDQKK